MEDKIIDDKIIIYGGAFNPPTIGHYKICEYLLNKFNNYKLIIMPACSDYLTVKKKKYNKDVTEVSYEERREMVSIAFKDLFNKYNRDGADRIVISDYEYDLFHKMNDNKLNNINNLNNVNLFKGTYYTLKEWNHPYFVIGADSLNSLETWIRGVDLIKENNFLVIPRYPYTIDDINEILKRDNYKEYKGHFIILDDFIKIDTSSSDYRNGNDDVVSNDVNEYIIKKGLYRR